MKTSLFDFSLPDSLIADHPANPRDTARMLVVGDSVLDACVRDLSRFLRAGDVMVFNDTRVLPARLMGRRGDVAVEILLHKKISSPLVGEVGWGDGVNVSDALKVPPSLTLPTRGREDWLCFAKPAKKLKSGDIVRFAEDFSATVESKREDGQVELHFDDAQFRDKLAKYGAMPLPPYIEKKRRADTTDASAYQTVYARHEGSVAAPTAGLHFTEELLKAIDDAGVKRVHVTLHVGGGTFLPVKADDTKDHVMHSEWAEVSPQAAQAVNDARANGGRVIAVGTTSLRTLESAAASGKLQPFSGETNIFITPGYQFKLVDVLLTNFHLPKSTLFMLVSAFSGLERMQAAYAHAIANHYRFYSYGDACLLYRA